MARFRLGCGRYVAATVTSLSLAFLAGCANGPASPSAAPAKQQAAVVDQKPTGAAPAAAASRSTTFNVRHALTVKDIPADSKQVRVWFWLPEDDDCQKVLDFTVAQAPEGFQITRDAHNGSAFLYAQVDDPQGLVSMETDFVIRRHAVSVPVDPAKAGPLTDVHRQLFAEYLRTDVPHMKVTDQFKKIADEVCGDDTNVVTQARKLGQYVVEHSDHYSIANAPKNSGQGDAGYCLTNKGGGCTDQHAFFIAMARARGIPTRLHFGTLLKPANEGKDMDPGYRCWVQYFVPHYGWVPMDLSAADTNPDKREFYYTGLDDRRIRFAEGRNLELTPKQTGERLNLLIIAYVEVDGKPHKAFERVLKYTEIRDTSDAKAWLPQPAGAAAAPPTVAEAGKPTAPKS